MIIKIKKAAGKEYVNVYDDNNVLIGSIQKKELFKIASRKGKTTIKIDNDLRLELDEVFGDNTSMNDVIRYLKEEHDKNKEN